jgi:hypothetical protein
MKFKYPEEILIKAIKEAEYLYGVRAFKCDIKLGEALGENERPTIIIPVDWNNTTSLSPAAYNIIQVQVQQSCIKEFENNNSTRLIYQISHEVIHSLMPMPRGSANYLEEGLAVCFSHRFLTLYAVKNKILDMMLKSIYQPGCEEYLKAFNLVNKSEMSNPANIKKLREIKPYLSKVSANDLIRICKVKENDAVDLLKKPFC